MTETIKRGGVILAGVAGVAASLFGTLVALIAWGMRCDESCNNVDARGWHEDANAWQWDLQLLLAVGATACAVLLLWELGRGGASRATFVAGGIAVILWASWATMVFG